MLFPASILRTDIADSFETLVTVYQITRRYIPEDSNRSVLLHDMLIIQLIIGVSLHT
jgi:hypothetical protein